MNSDRTTRLAIHSETMESENTLVTDSSSSTSTSSSNETRVHKNTSSNMNINTSEIDMNNIGININGDDSVSEGEVMDEDVDMSNDPDEASIGTDSDAGSIGGRAQNDYNEGTRESSSNIKESEGSAGESSDSSNNDSEHEHQNSSAHSHHEANASGHLVHGSQQTTVRTASPNVSFSMSNNSSTTNSNSSSPGLIQQQHSGGASSNHSVSNQTTGTNNSGGVASITTATFQQQSFSLPPELKKILYEVARTGKCTSLPWTASGISSFNAKRSAKYRRAAKKKHRHDKLIAKELMKAAAAHISTAGGSPAQHTMVKWDSNSNMDDNSSVKSNTSKVSNASKLSNTSRIEKKVVIEAAHVEHVDPSPSKESSILGGSGGGSGSGSNAPSHADSSSVVETGSLASQSSKRSVDLSIGKWSIQAELKRKKVYRDQSYASSCSESVSSAGGGSTISIPSSSASMGPLCLSLPFRTLRGALRLAVALVLEYSYKHRGGYKLSPAEKRRFEVLQLANASRGKDRNATFHPSQTDVAFMERRMRLLKMLGGGKSARSVASRVLSGNASDGGFTSDTSFDSAVRRKTMDEFSQTNHYGPPFTIQRVAEVLLMPERYYVQTHKLCNALEKLLLVTSPSTAFGGVTGGDTSQNRSEQREIAALADKKERDESEQRQRSRRLKRRISSSSSDGCNDPIIQMNVSVETPETKRLLANTGQVFPISAEVINAATTGNITSEQIRRLAPNPLIGDNRMLSVMAGDVPPVSMNMVDGSFQQSISVQSSPIQSLGVARGVTDDALRALQGNVSSPGSSVLHRPPSPSLYSQGLNQLMNTHQAGVLQGHHSGVLDPNPNPNQMEIVISENTGASPVQSGVAPSDVGYLDQVEVGRSSASNSDIDSESDDISFDDSASDRSDGSDFDPGNNPSEPFTAARVMALNRMQQQHRREQYLQDRALRQVASFQPPPDSEYQSGDSVDSTMAEDSCGSDSSSSDFTD